MGAFKLKGNIKNLFARVILSIIILNPVLAMANSGPTYWQGYPNSEILLIDKQSPIEVIREDLLFDFTGEDNNGHSIDGQVTAIYEMKNPTSDNVSVQMAFPFVSSLNEFTFEGIEIFDGDTRVPYQTHIGGVVNSYGNPKYETTDPTFEFESIVGTITNLPFQGKYIPRNQQGTLYTMEVTPLDGESINFAVNFTFDSQKSKVLTSGFNRYERSQQNVRIASWCYETTTLQIVVFGEDVNLSWNAYTDGDLKVKTDKYSYQMETTSIDVQTVIVNAIAEYEQRMEGSYQRQRFLETAFGEQPLLNLYLETLDNILMMNEGYADTYQLFEQNYYPRILTAMYTIDFPPNATKHIKVTYKALGTMEKVSRNKATYTFHYMLNPARHWANFENLNIQIKTPDKAPFVVESTIPLTKQQDQIYSAQLTSLPENDLVFTLFEEEQVATFISQDSRSTIVVGISLILVALILYLLGRKSIEKV